jgi:MFS family permease
MQSAFLIVAKGYSEKQVGTLFFAFGLTQFLAQTPAGYLYDNTENKLRWLSAAGILTTLMTVFTAVFASDNNFMLMVFIKALQGAVSSFIPPGLNSITQGIVGAVGMTQQVAVNEMMNHLGTAIIVLTGSLIAFALYPNIGLLFIVSPIACVGFLYFLNNIKSTDIDHAAARGLKSEANSEEPLDVANQSEPLSGEENAVSPLQLLTDPLLLLFIVVCFLFHTSNGTVLPLVMQTLAIGNGRSGILMRGLCIVIAQVLMVASAKVCGTYSQKYGRKYLFLIGLGIVPIRCAILSGLLIWTQGDPSVFQQALILSTQILDGVGAGTFGTMYILVTSDISGGTGRFGMSLGLTTAAMSIGGTVSGYLGQALAQDHGYLKAFQILMVLSIIPAAIYYFFMPETLPNYGEEKEFVTNESGEPCKPKSDYVEMV